MDQRIPQASFVEAGNETTVAAPLAIDLFCGLGGWTDGLLSAGFDVAGFDITRHEYARHIQHPGNPTETVIDRYPAQLVLQDILTVHGSQFRDAAVIVASPPCQNYSYLAMPWSRSSDPENSKAAKALRKKWETEGPDNRLFDACFRIQREAIEATAMDCPACFGGGMRGGHKGSDVVCPRCNGKAYVTRYIPLIVENVRGAVPWVGREKAKFGSFYLWGDVGMVGNRVFAGRDLTDVMAGRGRFGMGVAPESGELKGHGSTWFGIQSNGDTYDQSEVNPVSGQKRNPDGTKIGGDWFSDPNSTCRKHGSRSNARKAASAMIAKIPFALSEYVAKSHFPQDVVI